MSANGKGLASPKGKKFVNIAYCVGAALVIVGALMKLMHWPGWDTFLPIGMGAEAILFLMGAFEEPHHDASKWDWSTVYPNIGTEKSPADILAEEKELKKNGGKAPKAKEEKAKDATIAAAPVAVSAAPVVTGATAVASGLSEEDMKKWNESITKISETADNINKLSDIGNVSESYLTKLDAAGNAVETLAKAQEESATLLNSSTETLAKNYQSAADSLKDADGALIENYQKASQALVDHQKVFEASNDKTGKEIQAVTKNLTAVNSVYELQLNLVNDELKVKEAQNQAQISINDQLALIQKAMSSSVTANDAYMAESKKLENNITELNSIYGNMLSSLK